MAKLVRLDGESLYDFMRRQRLVEEAEWEARHKEAKLSMKYAKVKISKRRYMIVKYDGAALCGIDSPTEWWEHTFSIVEGCESLNWLECHEKLREFSKPK